MSVSNSGIAFAIGPVEEGRAMIGVTSQPITAHVAVCVSRIQEHAAVVEDANPGYWDEAFASEVWGGLIAPPAMIQTWTFPLTWTPEGSGVLHGVAAQVPVPGDRPINVTTDVEYFHPVHVGDRLSVTDTLVSISDERKTALGKGHFIVTCSDYQNQQGMLVARATNTLLRYRASEDSDE